jgi:amicyanin
MRQGGESMAMLMRVRRLAVTLAVVLAAVALAACGGSQGSAPSGAGGAQTAKISMKNLAFNPAQLTIKAGTTVVWTNDEDVPHTVKASAGSGVQFESGTLNKGQSFQFTFTKPGTYPYECTLHPDMKGTITVQ